MNTKAQTAMIHSGQGAFLCLSLSMLLASLGTSIANIALPALAGAFGAPFPAVQWVVVAYLATMTIAAYVAGRLGDRFGRRPMLILGLGIFTLASLGAGLAPTLSLLIAARAVQGVGAAFLMALTIALVRETARGNRIGQAMGALGTMSAVGTALGPSLGGVLIAYADWRAVFLVLVPLGGLATGLAVAVLPATVSRTEAAITGKAALPGLQALPGLIGNLLVAAVMMSTLVVGPFYLARSLGLSAALVGLTMSVGPVLSIFSGLPSGRLVDHWGPGRVLNLGLVALAAGALALSLLPGLLGVAGYVLALAILTPGYQMFQAANTTRVMDEVAADQRGAVSGLLTLARNLGFVIGASALGALFSFGVGTRMIGTAASAAVASGARLTFAVDAVLMIAALWMFRQRRA